MKDYEIIGWPEIQAYMDLEGFRENSTLITPNDSMEIGSSTYLVNKEWYNLVMEKDSVRSELKRLLKLEQNIEYYIQSQKASLIKAIASTVEAIVYTVAFIYLYKKIS